MGWWQKTLCAIVGHNIFDKVCMNCKTRFGLPEFKLNVPMPAVKPPKEDTININLTWGVIKQQEFILKVDLTPLKC